MPLDSADYIQSNQRAQTLSQALSSVDAQLGRKFFTEERREWIMKLPTESGEEACC